MAAWVNPCYELLDRAVVAGRADEPVLTDDAVTVARLLEDVAAVAGVLRAQGTAPGTPVRVVATGRHEVTGLLAAARLGAVLSAGPDGVLVDDDAVGELGWEEALRLGRTDPAPVAALPLDAPWTPQRTVAQLGGELAALELPTSTETLVSVLRSSLPT